MGSRQQTAAVRRYVLSRTQLYVHVLTGTDVEGRRQFIKQVTDDETTTHEQWLDVVHLCQTYDYHDCAIIIAVV